MHRAVACALAFAAIVTAAPAARAQEPPRTKEVKEAEKFITTALITKDSAERISRYQRALNPLQIAMTKDPNNARVWLTVGQVYAALHDLPHADSALKKAEALYPAFKPDVTNLRIGGWGEVFNTGVGLSMGNILGSFNLDLAITALEKQGRTRLLSSPKVTTQNNQAAEIKQGLLSVSAKDLQVPVDRDKRSQSPAGPAIAELAAAIPRRVSVPGWPNPPHPGPNARR